jgi:hypothetical protein
MKCGQDYHGGNIQNGCGHSFAYSRAPPYVAQLDTRVRLPGEFTKNMPVNALEKIHEISPSEPLRCDNCRNPIVGVRLKCVNCPSFNQCFDCSLVFKHSPNHVFKVLQENEYDF